MEDSMVDKQGGMGDSLVGIYINKEEWGTRW